MCVINANRKAPPTYPGKTLNHCEHHRRVGIADPAVVVNYFTRDRIRRERLPEFIRSRVVVKARFLTITEFFNVKIVIMDSHSALLTAD